MDKIYLATKLLLVKQQIEQWQEMQKEIEAELIEQLEEEKSVDLNDSRLTRVESNRINYDIGKMKSIFDKAMLSKLCDKEISVDTAELRELFCTNPELKTVLKSAIKVDYKPNSDKIQKAIDNRDLGSKHLKQFASVKTSVYIKTTKKEPQEDGN